MFLKTIAMKKYFYTPVLVVLLTAFTTVRAQDRKEYLGLPGDNLNLFAVMKLFQESETIEKFERDLNAEDTRINNLDLNVDGYVDYIRVLDNVEGNVHYIVLQVAVSPKESQDVAVFTVIRESNGHVFIQLIGDEALYGKDYIVEPIIDETPNPGYMGNNGGRNQNVTVVRTTTFEIAAWPIVRFIYTPNYVVWHSPWYYNYYPSYWRPWNQHYWHYYYGYHYNYFDHYYGHYRYWNQPRYDHWHDHYYSQRRSYSPYVANRIREGEYRKTYTRPETRREGAELYNRTRQAQGSRTNVESSGGRRNTGDGGTVRTSQSRQSSTTTTRQSTTGPRSTRPSTTRQSGTGVSSEPGRTRSTGTTRQSSTQRTETSSPSTSTTRQSAGRSAESRSAGSTVTRQSGSTGQASPSTERRSTVNTNRTEKSTSTTVKRSGERSGSSGSTQVSRAGKTRESSSQSSSQKPKETKSSRSTGRR
jgi:hypothetical protein